jgi:hypothetical protein
MAPGNTSLLHQPMSACRDAASEGLPSGQQRSTARRSGGGAYRVVRRFRFWTVGGSALMWLPLRTLRGAGSTRW